MRVKMIVNCPKCGKEFRFKLGDCPNKGWNEMEPSFKCSCGCEVKLKIRIDAYTE